MLTMTISSIAVDIGKREIATDGSVRLGAIPGDSRYFNGRLASFRMYRRVLSVDEVQYNQDSHVRKYATNG